MSEIKISNVKSAIQRLSWRIGNGKFEPNQNDVNALQFIIDWVNKEKDELMSDNILFAKCYVRLLMHKTMYYTDVKIASKELNKLLIETPIETYYDDFTKSLNQVEYASFMKSKGFIVKHPATLTKEQKNKRIKRIK